MTTEDVMRAIMAGNDVAMNWWAITHNQALPNQGGVFVGGPTSPVQVGIPSGTLVLLALGGLALFLLMKK